MTVDEAAEDYLLDRLTPQERAELEQTLSRVLDVMDDANPAFAPLGLRR